MKISLLQIGKNLAFCLLATGLSGVSFAVAAPKPKKTLPLKKPARTIIPVKIIAPAPKIVVTPDATTAANQAFVPSRFPGVQVRHVPQESPFRKASRQAASTDKTRGVRLKNLRRAANPNDGMVADVDLNTLGSDHAPAPPSRPQKAAAKSSHQR